MSLFFIFTLSCQMTKTAKPYSIEIVQASSKNNLKKDAITLNIPARLLSITKSRYNNTPLRIGPGYNYPLASELLNEQEEYHCKRAKDNWN